VYTGAGVKTQLKEGRNMAQERREEQPLATLIPSFLKERNVVKLSRWAGVFVLLSAPVLAV
jgi:hypothetical protein